MANGTIAFDTLTTSDSVKSGTEKSIDTSYIFNGVAKVFVNYSGTGTTFRNSFNCSSATDNGSGDYTASFSNNMSDANWCFTTGTNLADDTTRLFNFNVGGSTGGAPNSASAMEFACGVSGKSGHSPATTDIDLVCGTAQGDLA